jgi:hypothetical protein
VPQAQSHLSSRNIHAVFEAKMAGNARQISVVAFKWLAAVVLVAVLAATFAAYFHPDFRTELANFWAMCVAALR